MSIKTLTRDEFDKLIENFIDSEVLSCCSKFNKKFDILDSSYIYVGFATNNLTELVFDFSDSDSYLWSDDDFFDDDYFETEKVEAYKIMDWGHIGKFLFGRLNKKGKESLLAELWLEYEGFVKGFERCDQ